MRIFVSGVNGFIGSKLIGAVLNQRDWNVVGIDVARDRLSPEMLSSPRFEFLQGDLARSRDWVERQVASSDVIIPLAAVALPKAYIEDPLYVFDLDFCENLRIIELASHFARRLVFPSSSEVYGMCSDSAFDEDQSHCVLGPINRHRWIYSCCKQLLDRVIHAHGQQRGLQYTVFRPFNWIGPGLDRVDPQKYGSSRVLTRFLSDIAFNRPLQLVDGGHQRRTFLYIDDGIDALLKIIDNPGHRADGQIFNLGNPDNDLSVRALAELTIELYGQHPMAKKAPFDAGMRYVEATDYYGKGYQDVMSRRPSIRRAEKQLGWKPRYDMRRAIGLTIDTFFRDLERSGWQRPVTVPACSAVPTANQPDSFAE